MEFNFYKFPFSSAASSLMCDVPLSSFYNKILILINRGPFNLTIQMIGVDVRSDFRLPLITVDQKLLFVVQQLLVCFC